MWVSWGSGGRLKLLRLRKSFEKLEEEGIRLYAVLKSHPISVKKFRGIDTLRKAQSLSEPGAPATKVRKDRLSRFSKLASSSIRSNPSFRLISAYLEAARIFLFSLFPKVLSISAQNHIPGVPDDRSSDSEEKSPENICCRMQWTWNMNVLVAANRLYRNSWSRMGEATPLDFLAHSIGSWHSATLSQQLWVLEKNNWILFSSEFHELIVWT